MLSNFPRNPALSPCESVSHFVVSPTRLGRIAMLDLGPKLDPTGTREPLRWHSFFGHSFRFRKSVLASPSRRRGLGKGTAFESPSPAVLIELFLLFSLFSKNSIVALRDSAWHSA